MLYLKCTGIVQKDLGLPKTLLAEPVPTSAPLGNWYVNRFDLGRRKAYVFMSETTLLSFILLIVERTWVRSTTWSSGTNGWLSLTAVWTSAISRASSWLPMTCRSAGWAGALRGK